MKTGYLRFAGLALGLSGCGAALHAASERPAIVSELASGRVAEPLETWRFLLNPYSAQPEGTDGSYCAFSEFDEQMDPVEMAILRYFQKQGVDFMSVPGSVVSVPANAQAVMTTQCLPRAQRHKSVIFVRQTQANLKKIENMIGLFGNEIVIERVETKEK